MRVLGDHRVAVLCRSRRGRAASNSFCLPSGAPEYLWRPMTSSWKSSSVRSQCSSEMRMRRDDEVAAAAHPAGPFVADPDERSNGRASGLLRAVLEAHQIARRFAGGVAGDEAALRPAQLRRAVRQASELPHRVERHLRIVGAGLDRQIAAGVGLDQLVAVECRQVDQRVRPARRKTVAVLAVLAEQAGAEAERHGQPRWRQAECLAAVAGAGLPGRRRAARAVRPRVMRAAASVQARSSATTSLALRRSSGRRRRSRCGVAAA